MNRINRYQWLAAGLLIIACVWRMSTGAGQDLLQTEATGSVFLGLLALLWLWSPGVWRLLVRGGAVATAVAAIVWPSAFLDVLLPWVAIAGVWTALFGWVLVIPIILWTSRAWRTSKGVMSEADRAPHRKPRMALAALILATASGVLLYRLLVYHGLEQTSALFIGIPTLLAVVVVLTVEPQNVTGMICKAITIMLLASGIFLREGFICILMAAPLFLAVGVVIAAFIDRSRKSLPGPGAVSCVVLLSTTMSFEGVTDEWSFPRDEVVCVDRVIEADADAVSDRLSQTPRFDKELPVFLRLGFPTPRHASGSGAAIGDVRTILFAGGEGEPGELVLEVIESRPGRIRFRAVSDESHIAHWLSWEEAEVEWQTVGPRRTRVRWTLRYRRELDPSWYFAPWERYAVSLAAGYLIDAVAAPQEHGR